MTAETTEKRTRSTAAPRAGGFSTGAMLRTGLILVAISFLVGVVLDVMHIQPLEFWRGLAGSIAGIFDAIVSLGWETFSRILRYVLFGGAVVVPVWLVIFLINLGSRRR